MSKKIIAVKALQEERCRLTQPIPPIKEIKFNCNHIAVATIPIVAYERFPFSVLYRQNDFFLYFLMLPAMFQSDYPSPSTLACNEGTVLVP